MNYHASDDAVYQPLYASLPPPEPQERRPVLQWWSRSVTLLVLLGTVCFVLSIFHMDPLFCPDKPAAAAESISSTPIEEDEEDDDDSEIRLPLQESPDSLSRREELRQRFMKISGYDALHDPTSFQYMTWEWLADTDTGLQTDETIDERYVVALLYFSTNGDLWSHHSCNALAQETLCDETCPYSGIRCNDDQHIVELEWVGTAYQKMMGSLVTEIGHLKHLTKLNLKRNSLRGDVPSELGLLTHLTWLNLDENHFRNDLPTDFSQLTNLQYLSMSANEIHSNIPTVLGDMVALTQLRLRHNRYYGSLPTQLAQLTQLTSLNLMDNELAEPLPDELGRLTNLQELELGMNQIQGTLPESWQALRQLTTLGLWDNRLQTTVPTDLQHLDPLTRPAHLGPRRQLRSRATVVSASAATA